MKFNINTRSIVAALVALAVLITAAGGAGVVGAVSIADDSEIDETSTVYVTADDDELESFVVDQDPAETDDISLTVTHNDSGTQLASMGMADATELSDGYEFNLTHADLRSENASVGETDELDFEVTHEFDTVTETYEYSVSAVKTASADQSTVWVSESGPESNLDVEDAEDGIIFSEDFDTFDATTNAPNGLENFNTTTLVLDSDSANAFDDTAEDVDEGDAILGSTVLVQGELVPVYADSAGDLHDDGDSYAVYDTEASEFTVTLGEDREDAIATDVTVVNNDPLSEVDFNTVSEMHGFGDAISLYVPFDLF